MGETAYSGTAWSGPLMMNASLTGCSWLLFATVHGLAFRVLFLSGSSSVPCLVKTVSDVIREQNLM